MFFKLRAKLSQLTSRDLEIQGVFLAIALVYVFIGIASGHLPSGDAIFHYLRFKDASINIFRGEIPQFSFNTGTVLGNSVNSFYPWALNLPMIALINIIKPITWWSLNAGYELLIGLNITYFSAKTVYHRRKYALLFTLFYELSMVLYTQIYSANDPGGFLAIAIAPIAFFGWVHWNKNGRWKMMTSGMALLALSHVPTLILTGLTLVILTVFNIKTLNIHKVINGLEAFIVFIFASAILWLPILILTKTNQLFLPSGQGRMVAQLSQKALIAIPPLQYIFPMTFGRWDIVDVTSIVLSLIYWKRLNTTDKKFFLTSLLILSVNIKPIAIWLVIHTPFQSIQYMARICFASHMILAFVLINIIRDVLVKNWRPKHRHFFVDLILYVLSLALLAGGIITIASRTNHSVERFSQFNYQKSRNEDKSFFYNNHDMNSKAGRHYLSTTYPDYYPMSMTTKNLKHGGVTLVMPDVTDNNYDNNHFIINSSCHQIKDLPIAIYNQQKYRITVNGHHVNTRSHKHRLRVVLRHGKNIITVRPIMMWYRYIAILLSLIGLVALIHPYRLHNVYTTKEH